MFKKLTVLTIAILSLSAMLLAQTVSVSPYGVSPRDVAGGRK